MKKNTQSKTKKLEDLFSFVKSVQTSYNTYTCENVSREDTIFCEDINSIETEHNVIITSLSY